MVIEQGKFARVVSDKLVEHELDQGQLVYVSGTYVLPDKEEDPYSYRKFFVVAKVDEAGLINLEDGWVVDAISLELVGEEEAIDLENKRDLQIGAGGVIH